MATLFEWDGGSLPTIVGTTPSVSGEFMTFASGSSLNYASWPVNKNSFTLRYYVQIPSSWASSSWSMVQAMVSTTANARVNLSGTGTPGQVRFLRSSGVQIANSATNSTILSTMYRVEIQIDRIAQTYRGAVFALLSDTALYDSGLLSSVNTGASPFDSLWIGRASSGVTLGDLTIGRVKVVDSVGSWIGRHSSDQVADPNAIVWWDGGALPTISGSNPTIDSDKFMVFGSGAGSNYASWSVAVSAYRARFYIKVPSAWSSASWSFFVAAAASGYSDRINLAGTGASGQVRFVANGNTQVANSPTAAVSLNSTYRLEIQVDRVAQTYRAAVFALGSEAALYDTGTLASIDSGASNFTSLLLGRVVTSASVNDFAVGRVVVYEGTGAWIGRYVTDQPLVPQLMGVWDGSTLQSAEVLGVLDGSNVQPIEIIST